MTAHSEAQRKGGLSRQRVRFEGVDFPAGGSERCEVVAAPGADIDDLPRLRQT